MEIWPLAKREDGCLKWKKCTNKQGYAIKKFKLKNGEWKVLLVHRVVYCLTNAQILDKEDHSVSHRCHFAGCIDPEHLVYEPISLNMQRKKCVVNHKCLGHELEGHVHAPCIF